MTPDERKRLMDAYEEPDHGLSTTLYQLRTHPTAYDPIYEQDAFLGAAPFEVVVAQTYHYLLARMSDEHRTHVRAFATRCFEAAKAGDMAALEQAGTEFGGMVAEAIREVAAGPRLRSL